MAGSSGEVKNWVIAAQNGQVPDLPESRWGEFKKVTGVLTATVPIDRRASFYARWGDWLPWLCWLIISGGLAWAIMQRRRARPALALGTTSVLGPVRMAAAAPGKS